jgi:hypothetical protein
VKCDAAVVAEVCWIKNPTRQDSQYFVGNMVEVLEHEGSMRLLSEQLVRQIDVPEPHNNVISKHRSQKGIWDEAFEDFGGLTSVVVPLDRKEEIRRIGARSIKDVLPS